MKRVDIKGLMAVAGGRMIALRDKLRAAPGDAAAAPKANPLAGLRHRAAALRARLAPKPPAGPSEAGTGLMARLPARLPRLAMPSLATLGSKGMLRSGALALVTLGIALTAGQFVQSDDGRTLRDDRTAALPEAKPRAIQPLAATAEILPSAPRPALAQPVATAPVEPAPVEIAEAAPADDLPVPHPAPQDVTVSAPVCDTSLVGIPGPGATIDIVLLAPCAPDAAVVLRHAGLAISARTSASGSLFVAVPALEPEGRVTLRLPDGAELSTAVPTDLAGLRRIALQWQAPDRFQLHALEGTADYGEAGHVWAGSPTPGTPEGGWLVQLGDATVAQPLLAEVYTFPAEVSRPARVTVEGEVTAETCARDMLAETLAVGPLGVNAAEVTLAMPACDALGDFLVLNIPEPRTTLASAAASD
ncbi:MAG: hypothetical protein KF887_01090 [Paracoccaceae bacterium]|nr:MAG: hypothetical protein KF887_01090 [Paracoccaceae bacterium]